MSDMILPRMGDGERVRLEAAEIREDIQDGTEEAAKRAGIAPLSADEQAQLFEIIADPSRIVSVRPGNEVIVTDDGCWTSTSGPWRCSARSWAGSLGRPSGLGSGDDTGE